MKKPSKRIVKGYLLNLLSLVLFSMIVSCEVSSLSTDSSDLSFELLEGTSIKLGTLHFDNIDALNSTLRKLSALSESEIDEWEKTVGFKSFRRAFSESADEFHLLETIDEFNYWKQKYERILYMEDDIVIPMVENFRYQIVANDSGEFYVGKILSKIMKDKIVVLLDGDRSKLDRVLDLDESSKDQNLLIFPSEDHAEIQLRSRINCNSDNSGGRSTVIEGKRKAFFDIAIYFDVPYWLRHQGAGGMYQTEVMVRVHGHKKSIFGWNIYKTKLAYQDVAYSAIDAFGNSHTGTISDDVTSSDKKNLYYYENIGPSTIAPDAPGIDDPYFTRVKGRGITRGVGKDNWGVICCNYDFDCPSSLGDLP